MGPHFPFEASPQPLPRGDPVEEMVTGVMLLPHQLTSTAGDVGRCRGTVFCGRTWVRERIHYATAHISHLSDAKCSKHKNTSAGHSPEEDWQCSIHELTPQKWHHTLTMRACAVYIPSTKKLKRDSFSLVGPHLSHQIWSACSPEFTGTAQEFGRVPLSWRVKHAGDRGWPSLRTHE